MSETAPRDALRLDVTGEYCPKPIIELAKAIKQVEIGETVLVLSTDPGVNTDMPAWCKATRHELVTLEQRGQVIETRVRRAR